MHALVQFKTKKWREEEWRERGILVKTSKFSIAESSYISALFISCLQLGFHHLQGLQNMAEIDPNQGFSWEDYEDYSGPISDLNFDLEWDDSEEGLFLPI
jgi:hypothetical protein